MLNMKKISDDKYMHNLIRNLARQKSTPATVNVNDGRVLGGYLLVSRNTDPVIKIENQCILNKGDDIDITFFVKDFFLLFKTTVIDLLNDNEYTISMPDVIYSSFRRIISRHTIEEEEKAFLVLPETEEKLRIRDINTVGMSFTSESMLLKDKTRIEGLSLLLGAVTKVTVNVDVIYCVHDKNGKYIYGLKFVDLDWTHNHELFTYIFERKYPQLRLLGDFEADEVYRLFAEYLKKKPKEEIDISFAAMIKRLKTISKNHDITCNLAYYSNEKLLSSGSSLRIYNGTFLGHQLVSVPEATLNIKSKTSLYYGLSEFLMNHICFKYYLTYFFTDVSWHSEMYLKIGSYIDDRSKFIVDSLQLYECSVDAELTNLSLKYQCSPLDNTDEFIDYCRDNLNPLEIGCYSYDKEGIFLDEVREVYQNAGLDINRYIWKISQDNIVLAYAVSEVYSDGLNLFNLTDMTRLYFTGGSPDIDNIIIALANKTGEYYRIHNKGKYNMVFTYNGCLKENLIPGIDLSKLPWGRVMANREGGAEYWKLLFMNFRS